MSWAAGARACALQGERYDPSKKDEKPTLKLRGSKAAVEKARELINASIEANKTVSESVVLPWHAIDLIVGPNGERLRAIESAQSVSIVLPGQDIASENVGLGSGLVSIATSMTLRGRKKCVDAASAYIDQLAMQNYTEEVRLSSADADLMAGMCLRDEELLEGPAKDADVWIYDGTNFLLHNGWSPAVVEKTEQTLRHCARELYIRTTMEYIMGCPIGSPI